MTKYYAILKKISKPFLLLFILNFVSEVSFSQCFTATLNWGNGSCFGACDAYGKTVITGGSGSFTYSWSTGATTANKFSLCPGTYSVTVSDAINVTCSS